MTWRIILSRSAGKAFKAMPKRDASRVLAVLKGMESDPFSGDLVALRGVHKGSYRPSWFVACAFRRRPRVQDGIGHRYPEAHFNNLLTWLGRLSPIRREEGTDLPRLAADLGTTT